MTTTVLLIVILAFAIINHMVVGSLQAQVKKLMLKENVPEIMDDELYDEAKRIVIESRQVSASFLQRRLKIGYARAARIIDMLEENGVVGEAGGAEPRKVLQDK